LTAAAVVVKNSPESGADEITEEEAEIFAADQVIWIGRSIPYI